MVSFLFFGGGCFVLFCLPLYIYMLGCIPSLPMRQPGYPAWLGQGQRGSQGWRGERGWWGMRHQPKEVTETEEWPDLWLGLRRRPEGQVSILRTERGEKKWDNRSHIPHCRRRDSNNWARIILSFWDLNQKSVNSPMSKCLAKIQDKGITAKWAWAETTCQGVWVIQISSRHQWRE